MKNKVFVLLILFLLLMGLYVIGEGSIFIEGVKVKFASVLIVSMILYYYISIASAGEKIYLRFWKLID